KGTFVTRSERHEEYSGKPGLPEYIAKATGRSGTFASINLEGMRLLAGYQRSAVSDWLVGANIPAEVVEAPLRRTLAILGVFSLLTLALSMAFAYVFSRPLIRTSNALARRAAALGRGEQVVAMESSFAEFALVIDALVAAGRSIEQQAKEKNLLIA